MEQSQPIFNGQSYDQNFGQGYTQGNDQVYPTGDNVVFTSTGVSNKGRSKKTVIWIAIVGLVILLAVGLAIVFGFGGGLFGNRMPEGFKELKEFIEDGDAETRALFGETEDGGEEDDEEEEEDEDEDEDFEEEDTKYVMAIRIAEKGEKEVRKYYGKLSTLEQNFYDKSIGKVDSNLLAEYGSALKVMRNAIDYYDMKDGLISAYESGGETEAETYFGESIKCGDDVGELADMCKLEEKYYTAVLTEHRVYSDAGCYKNNKYELECAWDYYGVNNFYKKIHGNGNWKDYYGSISMGRTLSSINSLLINYNNTIENGE